MLFAFILAPLCRQKGVWIVQEQDRDNQAPDELSASQPHSADTDAAAPAKPVAAEPQPEQAVQAPPAQPLEVSDTDLAAVEAILFASDAALSAAKVADVASLDGNRKAARLAIDTLNERYTRMGCVFRIESIAGGYQMLTLPEYNGVLSRLLKVRGETKLSQAGLETLAIVAYKQPVLRADIEAIRGVSSGEMIRSLMEKGLVKIVGRAEEIGRPMLYGTTKKFLEVFGLSELKDLPQVTELSSGALAQKPAAAPPAEQPQSVPPPAEPIDQAPAKAVASPEPPLESAPPEEVPPAQPSEESPQP